MNSSVAEQTTIDSHPKQNTPEKALEIINRRFLSATTPYLRSVMAKSEAVRKQFAVSPLEADIYGRPRPFEEGKMNRGIYGLERIYEDRAVLTPHFGCASYCRFCFKKIRTLGGEGKNMERHDMDQAIEYIENDPRINTALITGGDPLSKPRNVFYLLDRLTQIPHVNKIRIGTRHILFAPHKITDEIAQGIAKYISIDPQDPQNSKNVSLGITVNHPDELQPEVVEAISKFIRAGVAVRGQITLLKGVNDDAQTLKKLVDQFLAIGIIPYYLFHCMDVIGSKHMRTSVQKGLDILQELVEFSGVYHLTYVYVTPVGKHRIAPGQQLNYDIIDGERYLVAKSPYKADRFKEFSGKSKLPPLHEVSEDGYVISRYLDGDDTPVAY